MKFLSHIQPRYAIAVTVSVALLMILSAIIELRQSREELYHVLQEEAVSLIETIDRSSVNTIIATEQFEQLLTERLLNNAYFIARLDSMGRMTDEILQEFAAANNIFRINVFNKNGEKVLTSYAPHHEDQGLIEKHSPKDFIQPLLDGVTSQLTIGLKEARFQEGQRYAIAVRRTKRGGGAIVLNLDAADLLAFRKKVGIGKLLQDLGDNSGIEYVALQDTEGIIAASRAVQELSAITDDPPLARLLQHDTTMSRVAVIDGKEVFEVARPLMLDSTIVGISRIGLSMDEIHATEDRMIRRALIMSIVMIALGALVMMAIVTNQHFQMTKQKLQTMETFTGNILERMQDAVVTIDADNRITLFNKKAEELFGLSSAAVTDRNLDDVKKNGFSCLSEVFSSHDSHEVKSIHCAEGVEREVAITLSDTYGTDGTFESKTAVIRDLTESRRLERELQRKDKLTAMGELASGVAHEIRNPLNAIAMIAQRFDGEFVPKKDLKEYRSLAGVLKAEARRVNSIIHEFLKLARPPKLNLQPVSIKDFISHLSSLFRSQAAAKEVEFIVSSDCAGTVTIDQEQMTQAVLNLLQNALDATERGGKITLHCGQTKDTLMLTVQDTGAGISPDKIRRIFDLYYTSKPEGTGMGLPIAQQIITQHSGSIDVRSEEGRGTRFEIMMPTDAA